MNTQTLTRKEIAALLGVSVMTVIRRSKEWQLEKFRCKASRRPLLYWRAAVVESFSQRGLMVD